MIAVPRRGIYPTSARIQPFDMDTRFLQGSEDGQSRDGITEA